MEFKEKYISNSEFSSLKEEEKTKNEKIILSNDAFAVSEMIDNLINKIEQARIALMIR